MPTSSALRFVAPAPAPERSRGSLLAENRKLRETLEAMASRLTQLGEHVTLPAELRRPGAPCLSAADPDILTGARDRGGPAHLSKGAAAGWLRGARDALVAGPRSGDSQIPAAIRIIGLDPGLRTTGWGVIETIGSRLAFVACGVVRSSGSDETARRLATLHEGLLAVIEAHRPHEAAVEETFVNRDPQSALKLGHARGVALLVPALAGLAVAEYAANLIKKTVTGTGHAEKAQVAMMVKVLLPKADPATPDAADALAVAITHAQHRQALRRTAELAAR